MSSSSADTAAALVGEPHVENVPFIECGFGNDSHGQSSTKAAGTSKRNNTKLHKNGDTFSVSLSH